MRNWRRVAVFQVMAGPDQGVRRRRGRAPHKEAHEDKISRHECRLAAKSGGPTLGVVILGIILACAQGFAAKIEGTVKDSSGAAVPATAISATRSGPSGPTSSPGSNTTANTPLNTMTDERGHFVFENLTAAEWTLKFDRSGFKSETRTLKVTENESRVIDVELKVAEVETSIEVQGKRSSLANSDPNYRALRDARPSETYQVENIELKRDVGTVTLRTGTVTFIPAVLNRVTIAVFSGEGRFQLKPAMQLEGQYLYRMIGKIDVDEEFTSAVFYFTDDTYAAIKKDAHAITLDASAANSLRDFHNRVRPQIERPRSLVEELVRGGDMPNLEAELLAELYLESGKAETTLGSAGLAARATGSASLESPTLTGGAGGQAARATPEYGSFRAFLHGKHYSDLRFFVVPSGAVPQIMSPEEVGLINLDPGNEHEGIWYLTHRAAEWAANKARSGEDKRVVEAQHYRIETAIGKNTHLASAAEVQFRAVANGARVVRFGLLPALRVGRVTTENGREISFIQEDRKQDGAFYAIMPAAMKTGQSYQLHIEYEGDHVVRSEGTGNFSVEARENWYPSLNSFSDRATYDLTFKVPKQYTLVSVGKLEKESKEDDFEVTQWKSDVPLAVAGFNYGLFKKKQVTDDTTHYQIETYATQDVPDYLKQATSSMPITPSAMADSARVEAQNAMRLFTHDFGPCPYGRIAITQQPQFNFGQSWPSLVYLPLSAFLDATQRWMLMGGSAFRFAAFIQEVTPHEVSHQWWGHMVGWASYHDQWLSEGFAEFSAGLFLEQTEKADQVNKFWDRALHEIADKNQYGVAANDAGPLWMGIRLDTFKSGGAYNHLVYPKGAYILQMIRALMHEDKTGDQDFFEMMQDYVKTFLGRNPSSEDFLAVVEKHMKPVLDPEGNHSFAWFYRDWVYGTDLPKYRLEYSLKPADGGKFLFTGKLTQSGVSPEFVMRVPIYFDFDGKIVRAGYVTLKGASTSGEVKLNLPKKPKRVVLNGFHDVLAAEAVVKEVQ
jgi:hypothetical protein